MLKKLIKSETRINSFIKSGKIQSTDETNSSFPLDVNSFSDFQEPDAKFNNWLSNINDNIKKFNLSQLQVNEQNLLENMTDTSIIFEDLISSMTRPVYFIELEIVLTEMFIDTIKVMFRINQYVVEGANLALPKILE